MVPDFIGWETLRRMRLMKHNNRWVVTQISPYFGKRILEVGAGIGNLSHLLLAKDRALFLSDISSHYVQDLKKRFGRNCQVRVIKQDIADPQAMCLKKYKIDTIVCVNVLEHIKADQQALNNMADILVKGGKLLLIVPALSLLYGNLDRELGHYRRYTPTSLQKKATKAQLKIIKMYYHNLPSAIGWLMNSRLLKRRIISKRQALLVDKLVPFIAWLENKVKPPFGLSLVVIAEKR